MRYARWLSLTTVAMVAVVSVEVEAALPAGDAWFVAAADQQPGPAPMPERTIALDFHDADVRDILRALAEAGGPPVAVAEEVATRVSLRFDAVTWREAFDAVVAAAGLDARDIGGVLHVTTSEARLEANERERRGRESLDEAASLETIVLEPRHVSAAAFATLLRGGEKSGTGKGGLVSKRASVVVEELGNRLIVRDVAARLIEVSDLLARLDTPIPQILIEAEIVEASEELGRNLGIQWGVDGAPHVSGSGVGVSASGVPFISAFPAVVSPDAGAALDLVLGAVGAGRSLDLRLTALEREGLARVVSRPRVVTLNTVPATIKSLTVIRVKLPASDTVVGGEANLAPQTTATERIETGIVLVVTPRLTAENQVALEIFVKSSQADFSRVVDGIPTETSREATSQLVVENGRTVVLGGIYASRRDDRLAGIPFFRSLPVLGWLFRSEQDSDRREDLLVFLTPRILASVDLLQPESAPPRAPFAAGSEPG